MDKDFPNDIVPLWLIFLLDVGRKRVSERELRGNNIILLLSMNFYLLWLHDNSWYYSRSTYIKWTLILKELQIKYKWILWIGFHLVATERVSLTRWKDATRSLRRFTMTTSLSVSTRFATEWEACLGSSSYPSRREPRHDNNEPLQPLSLSVQSAMMRCVSRCMLPWVGTNPIHDLRFQVKCFPINQERVNRA